MTFAQALRRPDRIAVIAEIKRASPSSGLLRPGADPAALARAFAGAGASALSVLTEPLRFQGSLEDLAVARAACALPVLRKDFLAELRQIDGTEADAVLLILRNLDDAKARALMRRAEEKGMDCLVETHTEEELRRALDLGARIVGVNSRNLDTLRIDLPAALDLVSILPSSVIRVIESGIHTREDLIQARKAGADAALIGTALMRAPDPAARLRELLS